MLSNTSLKWYKQFRFQLTSDSVLFVSPLSKFWLIKDGLFFFFNANTFPDVFLGFK